MRMKGLGERNICKGKLKKKSYFFKEYFFESDKLMFMINIFLILKIL